MIPLAFCIPGDLSLPTGGYRYDREVLARLADHGVDALHVALGAGYPDPSPEDIARTEAQLATISPRTILLIDGLALGAMPPAMLAALPHKKLALVHHPLGLEAGLSPERTAFLLTNEKAVLEKIHHTIVTSPLTKRLLMHDFKLPERSISVAEPGTARAPRAVGTGHPLQVLAVGAVSARKAYDHLVLALSTLSDVDWHLTIAGSLDLSPQATHDLQASIRKCALDKRITLTGAVDDATLDGLYARADIFAMSSLFEGYGMALTEALARGLPIVASSGGAATDTVPDHCTIKVPPGDVAALTKALRRVMTDQALRHRMADAAWAAAALLPSWDDTARDVADVIKAL